MRYRRSSSIILRLNNEDIYCYNFLNKKGKNLPEPEVKLIKGMKTWVEDDYFLSALPDKSIKDLALQINELIKLGIIIKEGSENDIQDALYLKNWKWGDRAGLFHFAVKNTIFISDEKVSAFENKLKVKTQEEPSPVVYHQNEGVYQTIHHYKKPDFEDGIFKIMKKRRTVRSFDSDAPLDQDELLKVIYAGLGIVMFRHVKPVGLLPLKMTPSGGGRNPYDAYVYCKNIKGLAEGIYHYSPTEHSLGLVNDKNLVPAAQILGNQYWVNDAPAVIFLLANIDRTMWKYEHCFAYKVVLIEAGHIAQNMILAANELGFHGSPTAAVNDHLFEVTTNRNPDIVKSCVYGIALGHLGKNKDIFSQ